MHTRTHVHAHTHTVSDEGMGRAVKNSLEIIIEQVHLEGGFKEEVESEWWSVWGKLFQTDGPA